MLQRIASAAELPVLFREKKRDVNFSYDTSQTFGTIYNQSAVCGSQAIEHSERYYPQSKTLAANNYLHREIKTGLCGVLHGYELSKTGLESTSCFEHTMVL